MDRKLLDMMVTLYGEEGGGEAAQDLDTLLEDRKKRIQPPQNRGAGALPLDETDALLITYGDQMQSPGKVPLAVFKDFALRYLDDVFSGIHFLPFFPYTSDDGFSISDFRSISPGWGDWEDLSALGENWKLMSDLVINHCSASHLWFKKFQDNEPPYDEYFITESPDTDLSGIFRPRTHPLLTPVETADGIKYIWTTFSADQADLNFANPKVLLEMIDIFLYHVEKGIQVIRIDAIPFLWKEVGHPSIHHPNTHLVVKVFRRIIDLYLPWVVIITESNVPHKENISYFGDGTDEAHMVYQFALPPLTLDAFLREDPGHLREWARELPKPDGKTSFFNFHASHDGVGLLPSFGILSDREREALVLSVQERGGLISYKSTPEGQIPYEMNVNYLSAVAESSLPQEIRVKKFLASQSIILSLPGIPGIYIHSFLGSENWKEGVAETGLNRTINRQKFNFSEILKELEDPHSLRSRVVAGYSRMLKVRRGQKAFHPAADMAILDGPAELLAFIRIPSGEGRRVLCLVNFSGKTVSFPWGNSLGAKSPQDLLADKPLDLYEAPSGKAVSLEPFDVRWIAL